MHQIEHCSVLLAISTASLYNSHGSNLVGSLFGCLAASRLVYTCADVAPDAAQQLSLTGLDRGGKSNPV